MAEHDFNLVFEGGGAKGLVFVGAMQAFESHGYTFGRLLGTSAGAITATLLAAGFSANDLLAATNEKLPDGKPRFSTFMDIPTNFPRADIDNSLTTAILEAIDMPFISERFEKNLDEKIINALMSFPIYRQLFSFVERGGLFEGRAFVEWLTEKLDDNGRNLGTTTLAQFNASTGRDLTVVASDTTAGKILVLNHRTAPDCPVVMAVRMSMSIPFVWQEVRWHADWGHYRGQDISGHTIVDGGVLSNFPIELLISRQSDVLELMGDSDNAFAVGMLIDEMMEVPGLADILAAEGAPPPFQFPIDIKSLATTQRVTRLVNTILRGHDKMVIDTYADGVCRLPALGYETTDFEMSQARLDALVSAGHTRMDSFMGNLMQFLETNLPHKLPKR